MHVDAAERVALDWGTARFTLETAETEATALTSELTCARVERLAIGTPWQVRALVPRLPSRVGDRELVLVAYVANADGVAEVVRFYVDAGGFDDNPEWATLARRIASTMIPLRIAERSSHPIDVGPARVPLARGWVLEDHGAWSRLISPRPGHPGCEIRDGELDARPVADPRTARMAPGRLFGRDLYWSVWRDGDGGHAETMTGAAHWGTFHVICPAARGADLDELRRAVEGRFAQPPP